MGYWNVGFFFNLLRCRGNLQFSNGETPSVVGKPMNSCTSLVEKLKIGRQYSDNGAYYNSKSPAAAATQATCTNIWYREDIHDVSSWKNVPLLFLVLKHSRTISAFWMVVGEGQENQRRKRRTRRLGKGRGELRSSERENLLLLRLACCQAPKAPDFHHVTFLLQEWWLAAK